MFNTILVPVDVTTPKEAVKQLKAAATLGGKLHAVNVVPDMGMSIVGSYFKDGFEEESAQNAMNELRDLVTEAGVDADLHVSSGTIYDQVITMAKDLDVDLIVIGAHRPELRDYLLGSNAARMVRHSNRSVLVLRD